MSTLQEVIERASRDARFRDSLSGDFDSAVRSYGLSADDKARLARAFGVRVPAMAGPAATMTAASVAASTVDASTVDASTVDASTVDASTVDASTVDAM